MQDHYDGFADRYDLIKISSRSRVGLALIKEVYTWTCGSSLTSRIGNTFSAIR
jgi:hypothetical protein